MTQPMTSAGVLKIADKIQSDRLGAVEAIRAGDAKAGADYLVAALFRYFTKQGLPCKKAAEESARVIGFKRVIVRVE